MREQLATRAREADCLVSQRQAEIPNHLSQLANAIDGLEEAFASLLSKASPVCHPSGAEKADSDAKSPSSLTEMGRMLQNDIQRIIFLRNEIVDLKERLEI